MLSFISSMFTSKNIKNFLLLFFLWFILLSFRGMNACFDVLSECLSHFNAYFKTYSLDIIWKSRNELNMVTIKDE